VTAAEYVDLVRDMLMYEDGDRLPTRGRGAGRLAAGRRRGHQA